MHYVNDIKTYKKYEGGGNGLEHEFLRAPPQINFDKEKCSRLFLIDNHCLIMKKN